MKKKKKKKKKKFSLLVLFFLLIKEKQHLYMQTLDYLKCFFGFFKQTLDYIIANHLSAHAT
jgi:hypothetical protein